MGKAKIVTLVPRWLFHPLSMLLFVFFEGPQGASARGRINKTFNSGELFGHLFLSNAWISMELKTKANRIKEIRPSLQISLPTSHSIINRIGRTCVVTTYFQYGSSSWWQKFNSFLKKFKKKHTIIVKISSLEQGDYFHYYSFLGGDKIQTCFIS